MKEKLFAMTYPIELFSITFVVGINMIVHTEINYIIKIININNNSFL